MPILITPRLFIKKDIKTLISTIIADLDATKIAVIHEIIDINIDNYLATHHVHFDAMWGLLFPILMNYSPFAEVADTAQESIYFIHRYMGDYCIRLHFQYICPNVCYNPMHHSNILLEDVVLWYESGNIDQSITCNGEPLFNILCILIFKLRDYGIFYNNTNDPIELDIDSEIERLTIIIDYLIDKGCNTNIPDNKGLIPIMYTTVPAVFNLVTAENVNAVDHNGMTVMEYAQSDGNDAFIQMMHQRGYVA